MTFENLGHLNNGASDPRKDIAYHADANKGPNRQADLCGIHLRAKTRDDPGVFHFADTFRDGGKGKADAATEFRKRDTAIILKFLKNMPAGLVQC
jgi:hypothetical protein